MMSKKHKVPQKEKESLEIIGFKLFSTRQKIDFFTIIIYGENDRPIIKNDNILFFTKLKFVSEIIKDGLPETKDLILSSDKASLVCDIKEAIRLLGNEDIDDSAIIINSLNMIFDLIKSIKIGFPNQYKEILFLLADHLTFDRSISSFFDQENFDRTLAVDGFLWCIGAILSRSTVVGE